MENNSEFLVTPMSQRVSLEPGQVYEGMIKIICPASATVDFNYKVGVSPYGVVGEDYSADLMSESNWTQIANWIKIEEPTGSIKPNETKEIKFTITVPKDAPGGAQHAALTVSQNDTGSNSNGLTVENVFEMASIIYASVAGETKHDAKILENEVPGFSANTPIVVSAKLDNHGNVYENASITIKAKNMLTGETILPTDENDGVYSEIVMPDTTRNATRSIEGLPMLGLVKIEQTVIYNGESSEVVKDVLICPIWFMFLVFATIGAIIFTIVQIIRKHRKAKRVEE